MPLCLAGAELILAREHPPQTVKRNAEQYALPLKILSYSELYGGWTMDRVVSEIGKKGNCASSTSPSLARPDLPSRPNARSRRHLLRRVPAAGARPRRRLARG